MSISPTCRGIEVLVVDDDALAHLLIVHVILIHRLAVLGALDGFPRATSLLHT